MEYACIRCGSTTQLIESHVVSKLLRKRFFEIQSSSVKYEFVHGDTPAGTASPSDLKAIRWRNAQDLPKPELMCGPCDRGFSVVEDGLARIIDAAGLTKDPETIYLAPCCNETSLPGLKGFMEYKLDPFTDAVVTRVGILTCWRALHMVSRKNCKLLAYLTSLRGMSMQQETLRFLDCKSERAPGQFWLLIPPIELTLELAGESAAGPYGWDIHIIDGDASASVVYVVAVWFAHWMLLWIPDAVHDDPTVSDIISAVSAAQVAATWPQQTLKPRVHAAASRLRRE